MAEAFLRDLAGDEFEIVSAGAEAGHLDPDAVAAMREVGIDISSAQTKVVDPYLRQRFHYVITLCDRETGAVVPDIPWRDLATELADRKPGALKASGPRSWRRGAPCARRDPPSRGRVRRKAPSHQTGERKISMERERESTREIRRGGASRQIRRQLLLWLGPKFTRLRRSDHIESL